MIRGASVLWGAVSNPRENGLVLGSNNQFRGLPSIAETATGKPRKGWLAQICPATEAVITHRPGVARLYLSGVGRRWDKFRPAARGAFLLGDAALKLGHG